MPSLEYLSMSDRNWLARPQRDAEGRFNARGRLVALLHAATLVSSDNVELLVLKGGIARRADIRTQAGFGHGDLLVGGALICPLGISTGLMR